MHSFTSAHVHRERERQTDIQEHCQWFALPWYCHTYYHLLILLLLIKNIYLAYLFNSRQVFNRQKSMKAGGRFPERKQSHHFWHHSLCEMRESGRGFLTQFMQLSSLLFTILLSQSENRLFEGKGLPVFTALSPMPGTLPGTKHSISNY